MLSLTTIYWEFPSVGSTMPLMSYHCSYSQELLDANENGTNSRDSNAFPLMSLSTATPVVYHRPS